MSMTEEERFRFDLAGFLVRPAILTADEVKEIREQIYLIKHDPESLPPEHRDVPGGPSSVLIDHPAVVERHIRDHQSRFSTGELYLCMAQQGGRARGTARRRTQPDRSHFWLPGAA